MSIHTNTGHTNYNAHVFLLCALGEEVHKPTTQGLGMLLLWLVLLPSPPLQLFIDSLLIGSRNKIGNQTRH